MTFIKFTQIEVVSLPEDQNTSEEQVQQEKQARLESFNRAVELANSIIDHNSEVLSYFWYMWSYRIYTDARSIPRTTMTRQLVKGMQVPNEEEKQILYDHLQQFKVKLLNEDIRRNDKREYAHTGTKGTEPKVIRVSLHSFQITNDNLRTLFLGQVLLHDLPSIPW